MFHYIKTIKGLTIKMAPNDSNEKKKEESLLSKIWRPGKYVVGLAAVAAISYFVTEKAWHADELRKQRANIVKQAYVDSSYLKAEKTSRSLDSISALGRDSMERVERQRSLDSTVAYQNQLAYAKAKKDSLEKIAKAGKSREQRAGQRTGRRQAYGQQYPQYNSQEIALQRHLDSVLGGLRKPVFEQPTNNGYVPGNNQSTFQLSDMEYNQRYNSILESIMQYLIRNGGVDETEVVGKEEDAEFFGMDAYTRDIYEKINGKVPASGNKKILIPNYKIWKQVLSDIAHRCGVDDDDLYKGYNETKWIVLKP